MKRFIKAIFLLACLLASGIAVYFLARNRATSLEASRPVTGRTAVLSGSNPADTDYAAGSRAAASRIPPDPGELVLSTIDLNLDDDEELEQVLTVRDPVVEGSGISIVVADFQESSGAWVRAWKGRTKATKPSAFAVQARDLLGDGKAEILCFGMDDGHRTTLTAFRRTEGRSGPWTTILSIAADTISVEEAERLPGDRQAWPIMAREAIPGSENPLDRMESKYLWVPSRSVYEKVMDAFVPGTKVEQSLVAMLLTGNAADFEEYLDGLWLPEASVGADPGQGLNFDTRSRLVSFHATDGQEVYRWEASNPTASGIVAVTRNDSVPSLRRMVEAQLTGPDRIQVRIVDEQVLRARNPGMWNRTFVRKAGLPGPGERGLPEGSHPGLAGRYAGTDGTELALEGARFALKGPGLDLKGGFTVFTLGGSEVLDLTLVGSDGLPAGRATYIVRREATGGADGAVAGGPGVAASGKPVGATAGTVVLEPARVLADRVEPLFRPGLKLVPEKR